MFRAVIAGGAHDLAHSSGMLGKSGLAVCQSHSQPHHQLMTDLAG
jgi:hypothetical protein